MSHLLDVENLQTEFHTAEGVVKAVNGISYALNEGEILGIVGESGSGKSVSVLSLLQLLPQPPAFIKGGTARFNGRDLLQMSDTEIRSVRGNEIAMIFQDPMTSLNPIMKIGKQIGEALQLHMGMNEADARARTIELLNHVGIPMAEQRVDQYPHQLSGGMRQRVMIALGLSCNPRLLIADEPTTALDVTIQAQIIALVRNLQQETGMAVIWITHDLGVVAGLADRVIVMYSGHVVEYAAVDDLFENPGHPYTLGLLSSLPETALEDSGDLRTIRGAPPDLAKLPPGCPFAPRCDYVIEKCLAQMPPLMAVPRSLDSDVKGQNDAHWAACWVNVETREPR
ncbi:MAG: ABC transporter ATP-binding protein [Candidatus Promineifilaceae bacterium]|nr:ABC transporter ATP-binding protein [Candidatus Promineifilaceae bacterium]